MTNPKMFEQERNLQSHLTKFSHFIGNKNRYSYRHFSVMSIILNDLLLLIPLILKTTWWCRSDYYRPYFTDEETETQRGYVCHTFWQTECWDDLPLIMLLYKPLPLNTGKNSDLLLVPGMWQRWWESHSRGNVILCYVTLCYITLLRYIRLSW